MTSLKSLERCPLVYASLFMHHFKVPPVSIFASYCALYAHTYCVLHCHTACAPHIQLKCKRRASIPYVTLPYLYFPTLATHERLYPLQH